MGVESLCLTPKPLTTKIAEIVLQLSRQARKCRCITYSDSASAATVPAAENDAMNWVNLGRLMGCRFANAMPRIPVAYPSQNEFSIVFLGLRFAKGRITFPSPERPAQRYLSPFWRRKWKWTHKTVHKQFGCSTLANDNDGYPKMAL